MMTYYEKTFFEVIGLLFAHFFDFLSGSYSFGELTVDERQVLALIFVGISCSITGVFLVVRKMTMMANGISHTILVGIVPSVLISRYFFGATLGLHTLLLSAVISSLMTSFLVDFFNRTLHIQKDASIGLVFTFLFACGVMMVTIFAKNSHIGSEVVIGNIDMIGLDDVKLMGIVASMNLVLLFLCYRNYLITSFDRDFAALLGVSTSLYSYILLIQTSVTVIIGAKAMGILLILALLVIPPLTARLYFSNLKNIVVFSFLFTFISSVIAVALSRHILSTMSVALSTSGLFVVMQFFLWLASLVISKSVVWGRL